MTSRSRSQLGSQPNALVRLEGVTKHFPVRTGRLLQRSSEVVHAVDNVTMEVVRGETLGLVGETGCGKSTVARCITRLVDLTSGTVLIDGEDISRLSRRRLRPYRRRMQMIFQDPYSSLNPRRRVGSIIGDPFTIHEPKTSADQRKQRVQHLMELVGLNPEHYNRFPADFSGGQRQRIGVARALALQPELIVADEPVSALDVSVRAQVINLLADLQDEFHLTYVFITHDLSVVRHVSDRVAVMYLGQIVEVAGRDDLYSRPRHPYTKALQSAIPVPDPDEADRRTRTVLGGDVPSPIDPPRGCRFHPRCPKAQTRCAEEMPVLEPRLGDSFGHRVACHFPLADREELPGAPPPKVTNVASLGGPAVPMRGGDHSAIPWDTP